MILNEFKQILHQFNAISLVQMDEVQLMSRTETKFAFRIDNLVQVLRQLQPHYYLLTNNNETIFNYKNVYFDTPDFKLYLKHHNGSLNRCKVRHRTYTESNTGYLELKFKNNKNRTIKQRIFQPQVPLVWNESHLNFLKNALRFPTELLQPMVCVNYQRITFVGKENKERITFDIHLECLNNNASYKLDKLVIAEVKQSSKIKTPIINTFRELRIKQLSLSKYCIGVNSLYPQIKSNNFKEKNHIVDKLINHDNSFKLATNF